MLNYEFKYVNTISCREADRSIATFTALAEPNRLRIVDLLRDGPRPVGAISTALHLNQPQVSKHLRVLKEARLVDVEPRAQQRLYRLRAQPLRQMNEWLERYRRIWDGRMDQLDELIAELKHQRKGHNHDRRKIP